LTPESHVKAHDLLTRAVQADPRFVQPYGPLVALYTWNDLPGITNEQIRLQKVLEIADKASAIDPDSAERHLASSWARFLQKDWHGAEDEIKSAIRVNPDFAHAHEFYCFYLSMQGRIKEAHREGQQAVKLRRLEPWSKRASAIIASWPYIAERRFDRAIVQLQSVQDSKFTYGLSFLAECYVSQTNYVKAIDTWKASALTLYAGDSERVLAIFRELREAYDTLGWEGYLRKWIELMVAEQSLPDEKRMLNDMVGPSLAGAYARLGETVKALKELEDHFNEPQIWHQLKFLPEYDSLHGESRFKALVKQAGLEP
jgi:tetratricopeptide (TPR) repeat protein